MERDFFLCVFILKILFLILLSYFASSENIYVSKKFIPVEIESNIFKEMFH